MSNSTANKTLIMMGIITGAVTVCIQILAVGEMKGQVFTIQQILREDIQEIKVQLQSASREAGAHGSDIAELKARVLNIERKTL